MDRGVPRKKTLATEGPAFLVVSSPHGAELLALRDAPTPRRAVTEPDRRNPKGSAYRRCAALLLGAFAAAGAAMSGHLLPHHPDGDDQA